MNADMPPPLPQSVRPPVIPTDEYATASLIIAILPFVGRMMNHNSSRTSDQAVSEMSQGLAIYWVIIATIMAVVAIVLGIIGTMRISRGLRKGKGLALAGIIIGSIQLAINAFFFLIFIILPKLAATLTANQ